MTIEPSSALQTANAKLLAMRAALPARPADGSLNSLSTVTDTTSARCNGNGSLCGAAVSSPSSGSPITHRHESTAAGAASSPPWGNGSSETAVSSSSSTNWQMVNGMKLARKLQTANGITPQPQYRETAVAPHRPNETVKTAVSQPLPLDGGIDVKVWAGLASALKQAGYAPHYRLYLACQLLDTHGSSRVYVSEIRDKFTDKSARNGRFLFSWRRMRQILNSGDGILWDWDRRSNKIFLRSPQFMAKTGALDLSRVGRAVLLPTSVLFSGQGKFNAHMHAAWLSAHGDENKPISQGAVETATAVSERTQRHYNRVAGVQRQKNLQIGELHTKETEEETVWENGHNSFEFIDYYGRQGKPNGRYRARQLPNSYKRRHHLAKKGRQRKINQDLAYLVNMWSGAAANEGLMKRYHTNGTTAAKAFNRHPDQPTYWQSTSRAGDYRVWFSL